MNDIHTFTQSTATLKRMNIYRLYLNVTFLSEMVDTQGDEIISGVLKGSKKNTAE